MALDYIQRVHAIGIIQLMEAVQFGKRIVRCDEMDDFIGVLFFDLVGKINIFTQLSLSLVSPFKNSIFFFLLSCPPIRCI